MPLFVYGTLRRGLAPASLSWLDGLAREPATAPGRLLDLGDYPGWVPAAGSERVTGELVAVAAHRWPALDAYEGCNPADPAGSLFLRERCVARTPVGEVACWIYRYNGPRDAYRSVAGGDWLARGGA